MFSDRMHPSSPRIHTLCSCLSHSPDDAIPPTSMSSLQLEEILSVGFFCRQVNSFSNQSRWKKNRQLDLVVHFYNPSPQDADPRGFGV